VAAAAVVGVEVRATGAQVEVALEAA